ncbi:D-alanyl-D-alanine carboxypeptidase family protein [Planotetraspora phitsanulokensis]|uniref:D-alanyl-D-alanine carboxypeptidase family protein n=1 Tax=Planotetraspora phitsanulokensis TaxID=575192 RepID=UPI001EF329C1|nr:D-alanyl-D-alanine carboxypeptidase [Planotetraspora phitsanulokensis]
MRIKVIGALTAAILAMGSVGTAAAAATVPVSTTAANISVAVPATAVPATTAAVVAAPPSITARRAYVVDVTTGKALMSKSSTTRVQIASVTKLMTAYVVLKRAKLNDVVTVGKADIQWATSHGATGGGFKAGERLFVRDLLYALMLPSAADAANALAVKYGPGKTKFVARMNAAAKSLGLKDTRYANADGLTSTKSYSTARDQAKLAQIVLKTPTLSTIIKTKKYTTPATKIHRKHTWTNSNKLLSEGAIGLKTGYTAKAGYCLAFAQVKSGHLIVGTVLGDKSDAARFTSARKLLNWAGAQVAAAAKA